MRLITPDSDTSRYHLRALVEVASAGSSGLAQPQRAILEALAKLAFQIDIDMETSQCMPQPGMKECTRSAAEAPDPHETARQIAEAWTELVSNGGLSRWPNERVNA